MGCRETFAREHAEESVTIPSGEALSEAIDFGRYSKMVIHMPDGWDAADIGFQVATTKAGTYQPLHDDAAALVIVDGPSADESYAAPTEIAGARWVKLWSNTAGADENQSADRAIGVDLKA